ncbi:uncharacterized protein LOC123524553 [Mercenaria mercenaria]|uniref:uncharacterized protein LOC123524553 n=1 Tax=Mercenaria mercenaria TaxID=6596 RepID=UPI00234E8D61|nr:uncharacterized protein LOC123524553 [Mercenaria mercenaria]
MFQAPGHSERLSLKLSEALGDIDVNKRTVLKRRRMLLLYESVFKVKEILTGEKWSTYYFGSQVEGSTTPGLKSDLDILHCNTSYNVIQDWSMWQPGMGNLLMTKDETTSPGYCLLQYLRTDEPSPCTCNYHRTQQGFLADGRGRTFVNHFYTDKDKFYVVNGPAHLFPVLENGCVVNGPAFTIQGYDTFSAIDEVRAYQCKTWPKEAQLWLSKQGIGGWPTDEIKRYCETTGCFVVPVGSKHGVDEELEWRISTSKAERCLMFCLNITQIRCYILMKMILKTVISRQCEGAISSFMCKNVLFHCVHTTHLNRWQEHNLLACLKFCLVSLQNCVRQVNCPHFIIPENNLMAGRISFPVQQQLLTILETIIQDEVRALMDIPVDDLGMRFQRKMNMLAVYPCGCYYHSSADRSSKALTILIYQFFQMVRKVFYYIIIKLVRNEMVPVLLFNVLSILVKTYCTAESDIWQKSVCRLLALQFCSSLGSVMASRDSDAGNSVSHLALALFSAGLNSDVSSSRLKFASALYCAGETEKTEYVLSYVGEKFDLHVVTPVCGCNKSYTLTLTQGFINKCDTGNEELVKDIAAFCVVFMRCEINCVPQELRYEMFRSTQEDLLQRDEDDDWMDSAVVDSLPYLYFLQYKTYRHLQRGADQQRALLQLATTIDTNPDLAHRETALNLLGQCFEQENRYDAALCCYIKSRNIRPRNNAANIHICKLLSTISLRRRIP